MPDFFLDVDGISVGDMLETHKNVAGNVSPQTGSGVKDLISTISSLCSADLVQSINGTFEFHLEGTEPGVWHLDLKNDSGLCGKQMLPVSFNLFQSPVSLRFEFSVIVGES